MKAFVQKHKKVILSTTVAVAALGVGVALYITVRKPVNPELVTAVVEAVADKAE